MSKWIDVTQPLQDGMVNWPGQVEPEFSLISSMDNGDIANTTKLNLSVHTGTHMDAPLHFINHNADITAMPIEAMTGRAKVFKIATGKNITAKDVKDAEQRVGILLSGDKVLFKTHFSRKQWLMEPFHKNYPALDTDAAQYLVEKNILVTGIDYLSIAPFDNIVEIHTILLRSAIWIIEGLDLSQIEEGEYEIIATPLKIKGADGSPARVLLKGLG